MRDRVVAAAALPAIALGAAAAWRIEVELRGWEGLAWVHYPHHAFPGAMAVFIAWALAVAGRLHGVRAARLGALALVLAALAVAGWFVVPRLLLGTWGRWAGGLVSVELAAHPTLATGLPALFADGERLHDLLLRELVFWCVWLTPTLLLWIALRAAGVRSFLWSLPLSGLLQFWAWPVAIWALALTGHRGNADAAHAVKSGFLVPLLVLGVGLPLLAARPPPAERPAGGTGARE